MKTLLNLIYALLIFAAVLAVCWLLAGCNGNTVRIPEKQPSVLGQKLDNKTAEQLDNAAAAVAGATTATATNPDQNLHTEAARQELEVAAANLPTPSAEALAVANQRLTLALDAATANSQELAALYHEAKGQAVALTAEIARLKADYEAEQARLRANAEKQLRDALDAQASAAKIEREKAKQWQARMATYIGLGLVAAGGFIIYFGHRRIGGTAILLGVGFVGLGRVLIILPDWVVFTVFTVIVVAIPFIMWWTYRVGYWQKPDVKKIGDYEVNLS